MSDEPIFTRAAIEACHKARCRNLVPKFLYLGRKERKQMERSLTFMGSLRHEELAGIKRPVWRGLEVVWVDETSYVNLGYE